MTRFTSQSIYLLIMYAGITLIINHYFGLRGIGVWLTFIGAVGILASED